MTLSLGDMFNTLDGRKGPGYVSLVCAEYKEERGGAPLLCSFFQPFCNRVLPGLLATNGRLKMHDLLEQKDFFLMPQP